MITQSNIMFKYIFLLLIMAVSCPVYSQNKMIKGIVVDECDLEPIIDVRIIVNDSNYVGVTDINGRFQIEIPLSVNEISFRALAMEDVNLKLSEKCDNIELIMIGRAHYDFMSYRRINKERRNLYKQLPVLHKNAYEKGIFQSPEPCYTREFVEWTKERVP
ncbi:MAG: hypothetical protein IKX93_00620 [Bacteroidaceae bacterium]|nr:hypothetical protein [Bacteroidaceae bacterium]